MPYWLHIHPQTPSSQLFEGEWTRLLNHKQNRRRIILHATTTGGDTTLLILLLCTHIYPQRLFFQRFSPWSRLLQRPRSASHPPSPTPPLLHARPTQPHHACPQHPPKGAHQVLAQATGYGRCYGPLIVTDILMHILVCNSLLGIFFSCTLPLFAAQPVRLDQRFRYFFVNASDSIGSLLIVFHYLVV